MHSSLHPALDADRLHSVLKGIWPGAAVEAATSLSPLFSRKLFRRGQVFLRQGEVWNQALLIQQGLIRLHFVRHDGREFNKNFFSELSLVFPLTPAMWSAPSRFGISCIEPCEMWVCSADALREQLGQNLHWEPLQIALLSRLLDSKLQREHALLSYDGRTRYQRFCAEYPSLAARVPLVHLSSYLGLTDVSLSRLRRTTPN
jgi:CRP-like cAMP-binding protein